MMITQTERKKNIAKRTREKEERREGKNVKEESGTKRKKKR